MIKSPFTHALFASLYIVGIGVLLNTLAKYGHDKPDTIFIPMFMLSLLVLSVSIMAFLFFFRPLQLYFENEKQEALVFFGKTVGAFTFFVALFFLVMVYSIFG